MTAAPRLGIACASGSYKGAFVHEVLDAFEEAGLRADVYACASSSTVCAAFAAAGCVRSLGGDAYWRKAWDAYVTAGYDVSTAVLNGIREILPTISPALFHPSSSRFAIAVSRVITREAAEITQGSGVRRLGQKLVLATRHRDASWAEANLQGVMFDTGAVEPGNLLSPENLVEVAYATTRMLHAWKTPAWIRGVPIIDASYTCSCPAAWLADLGCQRVIVLAPERGPVYTDFFQREALADSLNGVPLSIVQPARNLSEIGVDYLTATPEGLTAAHEHGRDAGRRLLDSDAV